MLSNYNTQTEWTNNLSDTLVKGFYIGHWMLLKGERAHNNNNNSWNRVNGTASNHVFDVLDTVPLTPFQPLVRAHPPQLRCHQSPVISEYFYFFIFFTSKKREHTHCGYNVGNT
jgi:hypothetical protein